MIVGIILGCVLALSFLWCILRCICGGIADCCCGCCDCCSNRRRPNNYGYQQPPPPPQYPMYNQYHGPQQPMYSAQPMYAPSPMYAPPQMSGGAGYRGQPTSPHEVPNKSGGATQFNEDALPPMPSWSQAQDRHVPNNDDMELGHIQSPQAAQQQGLLANSNAGYYAPQSPGGDMGAMSAAPAHSYDSHQQCPSPSVYSQDPHSQMPNRVTSMRSTQYEPSLYPPSYHTQVPGNHMQIGSGATSPPPVGQAIGRKPVQGTWRDV